LQVERERYVGTLETLLQCSLALRDIEPLAAAEIERIREGHIETVRSFDYAIALLTPHLKDPL